MTESAYTTQDVSGVRIAIYSPTDLPYGLSRMYRAMQNESLQTIEVFRSKDDAISWVETS